ncbi:MFS transporter [Citrobacter freundii complex sp. CFNIH2]|uniref:MFS transporter n=1 Tax=Citrobacter freundii complex sp. CFNIH2 TaxID=2066049 RepID=UPI001651E1C0|nr:MFS transporter [Citrobacter freundii complex sp. CFNIH2]
MSSYASGGGVNKAKATGLPRAKHSTRLSFFIGGFGIACWAPMVPFAQERLQADSSQLGSILLCLGLGALVGMPVAGGVVARKGPRISVISGAAGLCIALPLLATMTNPWLLAMSLLLLGASVGAVDVAANIHGTEVQNAASTPLMSGFHGLYSIGGLAGASGMTLAIAAGLHVASAAMLASGVIILAVLMAAPGFMKVRAQSGHSAFVLPRGVVIVMGLLLFTIFLAEGAVLDWGAILLTQVKHIEVSRSGIGYTVFAFSLTISRFFGDWLVSRAGARIVLFSGIFLTGIGLAVAVIATPILIVLGGIGVAGLAAGNVVPIILTAAGRQHVMSASAAIAATSTMGYLGILMGPALIGYISHFTGLQICLILVSMFTLSTAMAVPAIMIGNKNS